MAISDKFQRENQGAVGRRRPQRHPGSYPTDSNPEEFTVEVCNDSRAALNKIQNYHPDICLLDLKMPGMDGHRTASTRSKRPIPPPA